MKVFSHRFSPEYRNFLLQELKIDNLIKNSFEVQTPRKLKNGEEYSKCCRIDFIGVSGSTFLDIAGNFYDDTSVAESIEYLFKNVHLLNKEGIFVKVRFLLVYPYSVFSFSLIQAESSINRASIHNPTFMRNFNILEQVDEKTFQRSNTVRNQANSLEQLQKLSELPNWEPNSPNILAVRFSPVSLNICVFILNNISFHDSYLFAKEKSQKKKLAVGSPVIMVDKKLDPFAFDCINDHFRYLWDLDTTMHCEDATHFTRGKMNTLKDIKPPSQVNFSKKGDRIKDAIFKRKRVYINHEEVESWKFKVGHLLRKFSQDTNPTPSIESAFIACSWKTQEDGKSSPNSYAIELAGYLESDFGQKREVPIMSVHVLEAATGDSLSGQLYARLKEATLAIILLTKDIVTNDGKFYSKPNVYHELGYLMNQLNPGRLIVVSEDGVAVPSNINDNVRLPFTSNKFSLSYIEIIKWLVKNSSFVKPDIIRNSLENHIGRIEEFILSKKISQDEGIRATRRLKNELKDI